MSQVPTVKIKMFGIPGGCIINESDFDPEIHEIWDPKNPEPKPFELKKETDGQPEKVENTPKVEEKPKPKAKAKSRGRPRKKAD